MSWNHRVLAHKSENEQIFLQLHKVHYRENVPISYTENGIAASGDDIAEVNWALNKMQECLKKPILWAGEKFPHEYETRYKCLLCGRDKFTSKQPHKCVGGFRKRKLKWAIVGIE